MPDKQQTIVGFGDSITLAAEQAEENKWLCVLGRALARRFPQTEWAMINAGIGGNTSREGLARLQQDVLAHRPDLVLVEFGGNDAVSDEARHVPPAEYENNLRAIVDGVQAQAAKAILLTFPPLINNWHGWGNHPFYTPWGGLDQCVEEYRRITRQFAQQHGLGLADIDASLRQACQKEGPAAFIKPDGVHLTESGNRIVAETVMATLTGNGGSWLGHSGHE